MKRFQRGLGFSLLGFGLAVGLGFEGARSLDARPVAASVPSATPEFHTLGIDSRLELRRDPRSEIALSGRDAWLRIDVESRFEESARLRTAVELVDERGHPVEPPRHETPLALEAGGSARIEVPLPTRLSDGFYRYRVTAVARAGREASDAVLEIGLAVADGTAQLLTDDEWFEHSLANLGELR